MPCHISSVFLRLADKCWFWMSLSYPSGAAFLLPGPEDQGAAHGFKTGLEIAGVVAAVSGGCGCILVTTS